MAEEAYTATRVQTGLQKMENASVALHQALKMKASIHLPGKPEQAARQALTMFRSALDWLEDSEHEDVAHAALDAAGRTVRNHFDCYLDFQPSQGYGQSCAVALAHTRNGLSAEIEIQQSKCSICEQDPEECEHITGRIYDGDRCRQHVTEAEIFGVAMVSRPAMIDTRMTWVSIGRSALESELGEAFTYGDTVRCDRCLLPCDGFDGPK